MQIVELHYRLGWWKVLNIKIIPCNFHLTHCTELFFFFKWLRSLQSFPSALCLKCSVAKRQHRGQVLWRTQSCRWVTWSQMWSRWDPAAELGAGRLWLDFIGLLFSGETQVLQIHCTQPYWNEAKGWLLCFFLWSLSSPSDNHTGGRVAQERYRDRDEPDGSCCFATNMRSQL